MSAHRTNQHRLRHWIQQHTALALVLFIIVMLAPIVAFTAYSGNCLVTYLEAEADARDARAESQAPIDEALEEFADIQERVYRNDATQEDFDDLRRVTADLARLYDEKREAAEEKPLPDFPTDLCGTIDIA